MKKIFRVGRATLEQEDYLPPIDWLKVVRLVYDRNSFLLNVQKHSYCTQNFTEILFNRKRKMLLLRTEMSSFSVSVHSFSVF